MRVPAFVAVAVSVSLVMTNVMFADLVVAGRRSVLFYHEGNGALLVHSGADTEGFYGMTLGPDGLLYVAGNILGYGTIYRFTANGRLLGEFAGANLRTPANLKFGPDGNLYAIGSNWPEEPYRGLVIRYDGRTGAFIDYFISTESGGLFTDLVFAQDGNVYVADVDRGIVRYDETTGTFRDVFVPAGLGGLAYPRSISFGQDGHLYVANDGSNAVARFDGDSGAFLGALVARGSGGLTEPRGIAFGPDRHLYVANQSDSILRFNGQTGASLGAFVPSDTANDAPLRYPSRIVFTPPRLAVRRNGNSITVRWPAVYGNMHLMSKDSLASSDWKEVSEPVALVGSDYEVTKTCSGPGNFFRLEAR